MNLGQMLMIILAVVLFSTVIITIYNSISWSTELIENDIYLTQAIKIADYYFQDLETMTFTQTVNFDTLYAHINAGLLPGSNLPNPIPNFNFEVEFKSEYTDEKGQVIFATPQDFQKVYVSITMHAPKGTYVFSSIGDEDAEKAFTKVITKNY